MSSASSASAASSSLTRSRTAVAATCVAIIAVIGVLYLSTIPHGISESGDAAAGSPPPLASLRRSNALHGRRRSRRQAYAGSPERAEAHEQSSEEPAHQLPLEEHPPIDVETVADEDGSDWPTEENVVPQRNGQNVVQLLFRVSEEATRQSSYIHRGCHCDSCGTVPIRGIRYRCSNCVDYDLCEACEAQQVHTKTHIFYKIRVPASSFSSRQALPPWYPGQPDTAVSQLPKPLIAKLAKETAFERQEIYAYWEQFTFMANTEWREDPDGLCLAMDRVTFDKCLIPSGSWRSLAPNLIFDRMFAFYDTNHDGLISFPEFLNGLAFRKQKDRLKKIFQGYDLDGDGYVDRKDSLRIFRAYYTMYKALHADLLESLDDHTMSRTEAQQLISGRQPLSSVFGRETAIPGSNAHGRTGEGKQMVGGDYEVVDGRPVVNENGKDQGDREDVIVDAVGLAMRRRRYEPQLRTLQEIHAPNSGRAQASTPGASHEHRHLGMPELESVRYAHWRGMLEPPQTIDEFQHNLLDDLIRSRQSELFVTGRPSLTHSELADRLAGVGLTNSLTEPILTNNEDAEFRQEWHQGSFDIWPPYFVEPQDVEFVCRRSMHMSEVPTETRLDVIRAALRRRRQGLREPLQGAAPPFSGEEEWRQRNLEVQNHIFNASVKDALNERWKKRQFYTDEEEGMVQPACYDVEEDVPDHARFLGEVHRAAVSSPRPALSPRSRSSSKVRFADDTDDLETRSNPSTSSRSVPERWGGMEIPEPEKDAGKDILYQITQQAFNELLDPLFKDREDMAMIVMTTKKERDRYRHLFIAPEFEKWAADVDKNLSRTSELKNPKSSFQHMRAGAREGEQSGRISSDYIEIEQIPEQSLEELLAASGYQIVPTSQPEEQDAEDEVPTPERDFPQAPDADNDHSDDSKVEEAYLDPTLPQNRPNNIVPVGISAPCARFSKNFQENYVAETIAPWSLNSPHNQKATVSSGASGGIASDRPSQSRLYLLRNHDKYEQMAKGMGGWGRLSFEDWEKRVKASGKGFDYLGSWIDTCIP